MFALRMSSRPFREMCAGEMSPKTYIKGLAAQMSDERPRCVQRELNTKRRMKIACADVG